MKRNRTLAAALLSLWLLPIAPARPDPGPRRDDPRPQTTTTSPSPARALTFARHAVADPVFDGVPAVTCLLPEGWHARGKVVWLYRYGVLVNLELEATDPATGLAVRWLPVQHFSWADRRVGMPAPGRDWQGTVVAPPVADPAQFVDKFWGREPLSHLRGARLVGSERYPAMSRRAVDGHPGWTAQAVRLRYAFARAGKPWEQDVHFTLASAPVDGGVSRWHVQRAFAVAGPRGTLDERAAVVKTIVANLTFTPEWSARFTIVRELHRRGETSRVADADAVGVTLREHAAPVAYRSGQLHAGRSAAFDRGAELQRDYLDGIETYTDPFDGGGVYLPAGYAVHWTTPRGEIVLSERAGFDPTAGDPTEWRKMERRDPMAR